jgi:hypothetical protein
MVHKTKNVLDALPKSAHGRAKKAIKEITEAENKTQAKRAVKEFEGEFSKKWPKAVAKITSDEESLLAYYDYPVEHWRHLRTTNPIESPFATVRSRTDLTKGPGSREAGVAMIFKLLEAAEGREVAKVKRLPAGPPGESRGQICERGVGRKKRGEGSRVIGAQSTTFDNTSRQYRHVRSP